MATRVASFLHLEGASRTNYTFMARRSRALVLLLQTACALALQRTLLRFPSSGHVYGSRPAALSPSARSRPIVCQDDANTPSDSVDDNSFYQGLAAGTGLFANPIVLVSLYNVAATGTGLPAGPYDLLGALEGVSFLAVAAVVAAALFSKVTKGSGLPAGPLGLLGLAEGLSFLSLLGSLLVFPLRELGVVGDPATAAVNVPALTAEVAAVVGPLIASVSATASEAAYGFLGTVGGESGGTSGAALDLGSLFSGVSMPSMPDLSSLSMPDMPDMPDMPPMPEGMPSLPSLPEGLPSLPSLPEDAP